MYQKLIILSMLSFSTSLLKSQPAPAANDNNLIVFASDTQAPMWIETLWLKATQNRLATKKLFHEIRERRPGSLFLLGDVVNLGYSNRQWKPMDVYLNALREQDISVNAILGNHEVMGQPTIGQKKFQSRFPNHVKTGYVEIKDSIAIVLLNSNFKHLSPAENEEQVRWYKNTLEKLDNDSAVQYIITTCHHSPFTNSKIVGCSKEVQNKFVKPFLQSKKSQLFLSGHCHGFEHYKIEGKDFMVIGGGGGLHQPLRQDEGCLPDLAKEYKPLFHYLSVRRLTDRLEISSMQLKKDFNGFEEGMKLEIKRNIQPSVAQTNSVQPAKEYSVYPAQ